MKKVALLVAGLVLFSIPLFAGEYLMNDTGETVYGLRVVFSEPVTLASFGDILTVVAPTGESTEFMFLDGALEEWGGHWFNWEPASASLVSHEWFADPATVETAASDWAAYEASCPFWERKPNPTYEDIMAEIAEYTGPDEPLYEPAPDEAIWLTDLEGHADIYDNDSIRINFADWFDQSQITKVEGYRNGIKMLFLQNKFDVLTNEQMKTFDGNPLEHTPASSHTDHAIWGYEYGIHILGTTSEAISTLTVTAKPPFTLTGSYQFVNLFFWWDDPIAHLDDVQLQAALGRFRNQGWEGISLDYHLNLDSPYSDKLREWHEGWSPTWIETPTENEMRRILSAAQSVGLDTEVRIQMWVSGEYKSSHPDECGPGCRSEIEPTDLDEFFANYANHCLSLANILEEAEADIFTVFVEADSLERHEDHIESLLELISERFSGRLAVSQSTHHFIPGGNYFVQGNSTLSMLERSKFWDWESASGTGVDIHMNLVNPVCSSYSDQRLSEMASVLFHNWIPAVDYYKVRYPRNRLVFGEVAISSYDQAAKLGWEVIASSTQEDWQEGADLVSAICIAIEALGLEGMSFEPMDLLWETLYEPERHWLMAPIASPIHRTLAALLGGEYWR
jgi:hypothetical protein